jgi:hypothetical protein
MIGTIAMEETELIKSQKNKKSINTKGKKYDQYFLLG